MLPDAARRCYDCGLVKPIADFAFASKARGTRQGRCRKCHAAYRRGHYLRNRESYIKLEVARINRYRNENRRLLHEYLRTHPCVDCGQTDIAVLEFDHRDPATKEHYVTVLATHKPWSRVLAEIAKCDVRCANCHRRRTAEQFGWRRRRPAPDLTATPSDATPPEQLMVLDEAVRTCSTCGSLRPVSQFYFKDRVRGVRKSVCIPCANAYSRDHYRRNRAAYLARARASRQSGRDVHRERIYDYLITHPCVDCGESDPLLLEFDHVDPTQKVAAVGALTSRRPWSEVAAEIAKCEVRCANCHRRKTARMFSWARLEVA